LENNKAILELVERQFINEATAIQRLSLEHFSTMIALLKGQMTEKDLEDLTSNQLSKLGRHINSIDKQDQALTDRNRAKLAEWLKNLGEIPPSDLNVFNALQKCNLAYLYQKYRMLSNGAAHSTLFSAIRPCTEADVPELLKTAEELLRLAIAFVRDAASSQRT
jgi:uncharacterized membrane protein YcjF (UPF0283 family)